MDVELEISVPDADRRMERQFIHPAGAEARDIPGTGLKLVQLPVKELTKVCAAKLSSCPGRSWFPVAIPLPE